MLLTFVVAADSDSATLYVDPVASESVGGGSLVAGRSSTLEQAMAQLAPGDELVLRPGTYREVLDFRNSALMGMGDPLRRTMVRAEIPGTVMFKGSDIVNGWQLVAAGLFVKRPWTVNSQQVFVDGLPLRQIGGRNFANPSQWPGRVSGGLKDLVENSFFWDEPESALYIKVAMASLSERTVEVSVRPYLLIATSLKGLIVDGISFAHSNTTAIARHGCVTLNGQRLSVRGVNVFSCDGIGILLHGNDNEIQGSKSNYCGQLGMHIHGMRVRVARNETSYNNTRGFDQWWEAGGVKFTGDNGLEDSQVIGHKAFGNNGDGLWFDWGNHGVVVDGVVSAYNAGFGIHYEASRSAAIVNNFIFANALRGIYLPHSSDSLVANNLVVGNGMDGVVVVDEGRRDSSGILDLRPNGNAVVGNIIGWNRRTALILPKEILSNKSNYNLFLGDSEVGIAFSMGWASATSPNKWGLAAWRGVSDQDTRSTERVMPMPKAIASAISQRQTQIDWAEILERGEVIAPDWQSLDPGPLHFRDWIGAHHGPSRPAQ